MKEKISKYIIVILLIGTSYFYTIPYPHGKKLVREMFKKAFRSIRKKQKERKLKKRKKAEKNNINNSSSIDIKLVQNGDTKKKKKQSNLNQKLLHT